MNERDELARLRTENRALQRAIVLLNRVATLVREPPELKPACYALLTGVTAGVGLGLNRAMLFFCDDEDRSVLRGVAAVGPSDAVEADRVWRSIESDAPDLPALYEAGLRCLQNPTALDRQVRQLRVPIDSDSPIALALRRAAPVRFEGSDDLDGLLDLSTAVAAPLRGRDAIRGVLYADNRFTEELSDSITLMVFALVADQAGRAIDTAHRFERIALQARTDALTGLGHHGAMMEAIAAAVTTARDCGRPLGLIMIDLDDFKQVNDSLGHLAGDALLAAVAARLQSELRAGATAFRYGGEEFAVLVPGVDEQALRRAAERLRQAVARQPFAVGKTLSRSVTCSIGVASLQPEHAEQQQLIAAADRALLHAKSSGKNRVELA